MNGNNTQNVRLMVFIDESSVVELSGGGAVIPLPVNASYRHSFAGVEYYSDAGITPVVPSAGTETYTLTTTVKPSSKQSFAGSVINSADETQVSWAANITSLEVTLAGVVGATHVKLLFSGNIS